MAKNRIREAIVPRPCHYALRNAAASCAVRASQPLSRRRTIDQHGQFCLFALAGAHTFDSQSRSAVEEIHIAEWSVHQRGRTYRPAHALPTLTAWGGFIAHSMVGSAMECRELRPPTFL